MNHVRVRAVLAAVLLMVPALMAGAGGDGGRDGRSEEDTIEWINPTPTGSYLNGVAWRPGAANAVMVGQAGTVMSFAPFGNPRFTMLQSGTSEDLNAVSFQPGGTSALIAGNAGTLLRMEGTTFSPVWSGTQEDLWDIAWRPDGAEAVMVGEGGTVLVYRGDEVVALNSTVGLDFRSATWFGDAGYALAVGEGGLAARCNGTACELLTTATNLNLFDVTLLPGSRKAYAVGSGGTVLSFDGVSFAPVASAPGQSFYAMSVKSDASLGLIVGYDNDAQASSVYGLDSNQAFFRIPTNLTLTLRDVLWEPGDDLALVVGSRGLVAEYDGTSFDVLSAAFFNDLSSAAWRSDGSAALVAGSGGYVALFNGTKFTRLVSPRQVDLKCVAWHPGDDTALICGREGTVLKFHPGNLSLEVLDTGLAVPVNFTSLSWKPDGSHALLVGDLGKMVKYDGSDFTLQQVTGEMAVNYMDVAWRPDGAFALIAGVSGNVLKYTEALLPPRFSVSRVPSVGGPGTAFFSIAWRSSPLEALLSGSNGVVARYNETGMYLLPTGTTRFLYSIAWMPGSDYAMAAGMYGKLLLWVGYGFINPSSGSEATFLDLTFKPDGSCALVLGQSGTVMKYTVARRTSPRALISSPRANAVYEPGVAVLFDGSNSTPTFGEPLTFRWSSNRSGLLDTQARFAKVPDPGTHLVTLTVEDASGHSSSASVTITVKMPNRPPSVVMLCPLEGATFNNTDPVAFDSTGTSDPDGDVLSFLWTSSRDGRLSTEPAFTRSLNIGAHLLTLWVDDGRGHNVSARANLTVVLFNRPPSVVVSSPFPGSENTTKFAVHFDASGSEDPDGDSLGFFWTSNISGYLSSAPRFSRLMPAGRHLITVWVDDSNGANLSASLNITIRPANQPPVVTVDYPLEGAVLNRSFEVTGVALDPDGPVARVWFRIDGSDWQEANGTSSWRFEFNTTGLPNGQHAIRVKASDGTDDSEEVLRNVTLHDPAWGFSVSISFPLDGTTVKGITRLMGTASRIDSVVALVEVSVDDGPWRAADGTSAWELNWDTRKVKNGWHHVAVRAFDGTDLSPEVSVLLRVDNPSGQLPSSLWPFLGGALLLVLLMAGITYMAFSGSRGRARSSRPRGPVDEEE